MMRHRKFTTRSSQILALLAIAQLMGVLDFSIVTVALPSIQQEFHLTPTDLQWIVSVYALLFGGFLLVGGRATDLFDRKWIFLLGLGLFSASSLAGGLAPSPLVILLARAAQGLGAAILSPAALALLTTTFPEGEARNRALGIFGSVASIGFSVGVILGGVLTSLLSWRWVFFVNVPLGLLVLVGALLLLPSSRTSDARQSLDLIGAVLFTGAIASLVLALSQLASPGAGRTQVLIFVFMALVLAVVFIFIERRSRNPLVPLFVFGIRNLSVANLLGVLTFAMGSLFAFVLTLYLQGVLGLSPLATGLVFLPAGVGGIIGGQMAAQAIRRVGLRPASVLGPALIALGSLLMAQITPVEGVAWVAVGYMIAGIGIVCMMVTTTIAATAQLGPELQGLAAGLFNTSQQVGAALGTSLASLVATSVGLALSDTGKVATTRGDQAALYLALGLALLSGSLAHLLIRTSRPQPSRVTSIVTEQHVKRYKDKKKGNITMAIEIVIFHLQPTVTSANFLAAVEETTALLKTQDGFISRTVSSADSGEWLDILSWESVEAAKAAAAVFQTNPAGKRFSEYMDPQQNQVFYTETIVNQH